MGTCQKGARQTNAPHRAAIVESEWPQKLFPPLLVEFQLFHPLTQETNCARVCDRFEIWILSSTGWIGAAEQSQIPVPHTGSCSSCPSEKRGHDFKQPDHISPLQHGFWSGLSLERRMRYRPPLDQKTRHHRAPSILCWINNRRSLITLVAREVGVSALIRTASRWWRC